MDFFSSFWYIRIGHLNIQMIWNDIWEGYSNIRMGRLDIQIRKTNIRISWKDIWEGYSDIQITHSDIPEGRKKIEMVSFKRSF